MRNVFINSFRIGLRQWRVTAIVYFFQLCLVLTLGMQVYDVLKASIGSSLEINKLLANYDHTVLTDFLKVHGASITPLIGQLRWLLLVWLIFSVFIDGGLLYCAVAPERAGGRAFWEGGARYFFRFLKISLFMLLLAVVWTAVIWLPMLLSLQSSLEYFSTEKPTVWLVLGLLAVYVFGLAVLLLWSVVSRIRAIQTAGSVAQSIKYGGRIFWQNKGRLLGLLAGFGLVQVVFLALYWHLEAAMGMTSPGAILVVFGLQQGFVFFRILVRQMVYVGVAGWMAR